MAYIKNIKINNFRGIKNANIDLEKNSVLVGDNNTGKTTLLEAIDLVLGPDRLNRYPIIEEHDFFKGKYIAEEESGNTDMSVENNVSKNPIIKIEAMLIDLNEIQNRRFEDYIEFWDKSSNKFCDTLESTNSENACEAIRITFKGWYDEEEDDFKGGTYFSRSIENKPVDFSKKHKQLVGFLYLRNFRTGSRALSLERGSLLDIILRLKEVRPKMWENTIQQLSDLSVTGDDTTISPILESIDKAIKEYVPKEWGVAPNLKVSKLTREHLRKTITAFLSTGNDEHTAPFYRQGTGTINILILAMLSQIAELKNDVIFAMEEPETSIPPYAQKRIVQKIRNLSSQSIFTSHSPYVIEEFEIEDTIVLKNDVDGKLVKHQIILPNSIKPKRYVQEFRTKFCEGLLARRVLIAEGPTEYTAFAVAARHLESIDSSVYSSVYSSLESMGVCIINAGGDGSIIDIARLYKNLGKDTFAICDKQKDTRKNDIQEQVRLLFMHEYKGFEELIVENSSEDTLIRFLNYIELPQHISQNFPTPSDNVKDAILEYLKWGKGIGVAAEFISQCSEDEIPQWIKDSCKELKKECEMNIEVHETDDEIEQRAK